MWHSQSAKPKKTRQPSLSGSAIALLSAIILFTPSPSEAVNYHEGIDVFCGNCHRTHGEGWELRSSQGDNTTLCLRCHSKTGAKAPDVLTEGKSAGLLKSYGRVFKGGHDLGVAAMTPSMEGLTSLECTTCHDPHGNDNYRNLLPNPLNPKGAAVEVTVKEKPGRGKYEEVRYIKGISAWCQTCHTDLYAEQPGKRAHHKVGVRIRDLLQKVKLKRPITVELPMNDPLGNTRKDDTASAQDDTVNCITCHYAHGSNNPYSLRYADGATLKSTCRSCHVAGVKRYKGPSGEDKPRKPSVGIKQPKPR